MLCEISPLREACDDCSQSLSFYWVKSRKQGLFIKVQWHRFTRSYRGNSLKSLRRFKAASQRNKRAFANTELKMPGLTCDTHQQLFAFNQKSDLNTRLHTHTHTQVPDLDSYTLSTDGVQANSQDDCGCSSWPLQETDGGYLWTC